jgi:hypothetical protein
VTTCPAPTGLREVERLGSTGRLIATYAMRTSRLGRWFSLAALAGQETPSSDSWNRWRLVVRVESTADGLRTATEGDMAFTELRLTGVAGDSSTSGRILGSAMSRSALIVQIRVLRGRFADRVWCRFASSPTFRHGGLQEIVNGHHTQDVVVCIDNRNGD